MGTEHADLLEASPLLIKLNHTQLSETLYQHIQQERSGIFIQSQESNILPHLQYLFIMHSEVQGQVYARYYDPLFWTALQLSLPEQQTAIWGNLQRVYTLAPDAQTGYGFINWARSEQDKGIYIQPQEPLYLASQFVETSEMVQLYYLLCSACYEQQLALPEDKIINALLNLKAVAKAGITQAHLLQKLVRLCIEQVDLALVPEVENLLQADLPDYDKVEAIIGLYEGN